MHTYKQNFCLLSFSTKFLIFFLSLSIHHYPKYSPPLSSLSIQQSSPLSLFRHERTHLLGPISSHKSLISSPMGVRFDCASSVLLCAEDNSSILEFDGDDDEVDEMGPKGVFCGQRCDFYGDPLMGLSLASEERLSEMVKRECGFLPRRDYAKRLVCGDLDVSFRRDAIEWILKVRFF